MKMIAAVDRNWSIGKDGNLLVRIPEDQKFFKRMTLGKTVVMGRKTLDSLPGGRALKDRANIVLTRNPDFARENDFCEDGSASVRCAALILQQLEKRNVK